MFVLLLFGAPGFAQTSTVPFIGCPSDGQVGPLAAPAGHARQLLIPPATAARLAWYKAANAPGVLAPRGWHCFSTYGSSRATLYISPGPLTAKLVLPGNGWNGFSGSAIEISRTYGDTSGRFMVAEIIARVFPAHRDFVQKVIAEGIMPVKFSFGPYPTDKLTYKNKEMVEYITPANTDGLGTNSELKKDGAPISGVAILAGEGPNLIHLATRLPPNMLDLTPAIIQQVERDAPRLQKIVLHARQRAENRTKYLSSPTTLKNHSISLNP